MKPKQGSSLVAVFTTSKHQTLDSVKCINTRVYIPTKSQVRITKCLTSPWPEC